FVTVAGEDGKDGTGAVLVVADGKATPFATGFDRPSGMVAFQGQLFVADAERVWRIDPKGKATVFADASAFPVPPQKLFDITADETGALYVTDMLGAAIFRVDPKGKVRLVTDSKRTPALREPPGIAMDSMMHLLVLDARECELHRVAIADGKSEKLAGNLFSPRLAYDHHGRLFVANGSDGVFAIPRPGTNPVQVTKD